MMQEAIYTQFKELIRLTCGFYLEGEREETLVQAIQKRMNERKISILEGYHATLIREPGEVLALIELLTVNETYFFREPDHLKLVVDTLIPELLVIRQYGTIRILSVGCSTGEEPYSIAMLLKEKFGSESERLFSITAVDIDSSVIETAKAGIYRKPSFRGIDPLLFERYFSDVGGGRFRLSENIRNQVKFEVMNLIGGSYSLGMGLPDFIFYRNISIYFPKDVQRKVFGRLAELLNQGGAIIVGAAETLHHDVGILPLITRNSLFFFRKPPFYPVHDEYGNRRKLNCQIDSAPENKISKKIDIVKPFLPEHKALTATEVPRIVPVSPDPHKEYGIALNKARNNKHDEALELTEMIVSYDGSFIKAHGLKASLQLALARFDDAQESAERLIALDALCAEGFLMLGIIARHKGDNDMAFKRFREAMYLNTSCWMSHFYTAEILFSRQEHKRARGNYETVVRILESDLITTCSDTFFPLSFNAGQFITICRHKLTILKEIQ